MGMVAEQPIAYPQRLAISKSCCHPTAEFTPAAPQGLRPRKCAPALGKKGLSTQTALALLLLLLIYRAIKE
jgi:hypothetical protein